MLEEVQASFQLENWNTELDTLSINRTYLNTALSFKEKKMTKAPLPDSVRIGQVSLAVFQTVIFS